MGRVRRLGATRRIRTRNPGLRTIAGGAPLAVVTTPGGVSDVVPMGATAGRTMYVVHNTRDLTGNLTPVAAFGVSLGASSTTLFLRTGGTNVNRYEARVQTSGGTYFPATTDARIRVAGTRQVSAVTVVEGATSAIYEHHVGTRNTVTMTPGTGLATSPQLYLGAVAASEAPVRAYAFPAHSESVRAAVMAFLAAGGV